MVAVHPERLIEGTVDNNGTSRRVLFRLHMTPISATYRQVSGSCYRGYSAPIAANMASILPVTPYRRRFPDRRSTLAIHYPCPICGKYKRQTWNGSQRDAVFWPCTATIQQYASRALTTNASRCSSSRWVWQ